MKIILVDDIYKLGKAGDVVTCANGYARNYLLPQKKAIMATEFNLKKIESIKKVAEEKKLEKFNEWKALAAKINNVEISFVRKADEHDHLFGSVSDVDIVNELEKLDLKISRVAIVLDKHIKELGEFDVDINIATDITAKIKVKVEKE